MVISWSLKSAFQIYRIMFKWHHSTCTTLSRKQNDQNGKKDNIYNALERPTERLLEEEWALI